MSDPGFEAMRPLLVSVDGDDAVRVALEHRTELFVAERRVDPDAPHGRAHAAAEATAEALGLVTPSAVSFTLQWCAVLETGVDAVRLAVALVGVDIAGAAMRYAGAVVVGADPAVAAAKAVLDALNRRLGVTGL